MAIKGESLTARTFHLSRILSFLEGSEGFFTIKTIMERCGMGRAYVNNALKFLVKHFLVDEVKTNAIKLYSLNKRRPDVERNREINLKSYEKNRKKILREQAIFYKKNRERLLAKSNKRYKKKKLEVLKSHKVQ